MRCRLTPCRRNKTTFLSGEREVCSKAHHLSRCNTIGQTCSGGTDARYARVVKTFAVKSGGYLPARGLLDLEPDRGQTRDNRLELLIW